MLHSIGWPARKLWITVDSIADRFCGRKSLPSVCSCLFDWPERLGSFRYSDMSYEGRKPSSFYSSTNYLSPLERKRLRAIENETPATERTDQTSSKRTSKKSAPKRRDNAGKKQPPGKRKRSVSDSSRVTRAKSRTQASVTAHKASSAAAKKKAVVIPLSEQAILPSATSENPETEPPAKKVRKFFSSGLRAPAGASSTSMAVATAVSWNPKFKLKFEPTVAPLKKPSTPAASLKPAKKELVMTVPFRQAKKATVETVTSARSVGPALPGPTFREPPVEPRVDDAGPGKSVSGIANTTARRTLVMTVPFRRPRVQAATVASGSRVDVTMQEQVPRKPPEQTRAENVETPDNEYLETRAETSRASVSSLGVKTDVLEEAGHEFSGVCEPCGRKDDNDEGEERHSSAKKDDSLSSTTKHEQSIAHIGAELNQSKPVVTTPVRDSSTRSFIFQDCRGTANHSLPLRALCTNIPDTTDGRKFGDRSLPLRALCVDTPDKAGGSRLAERPSTPPPDSSHSPNRQSLYPIFSTPTSNRKTRMELRQIPASPIEVPKKRFMPGSSDPAQLIIDAGQKKFGHTTCAVCGMVYTIGEVEDEKLHTKYHQSFLAVVKFPGWKNQREVGLYPDGKIIMVSPNDPKNMLNKMDEIRQMVDRELGILEDEATRHAPQMYFVFVSYSKKVLGFLSAQEIKQGYRVIPNENSDGNNTYCCECDPKPAVCGVTRIWTAPFYRRKKVASRLLNRLRMNFSFGCPLELRKIAFSDPTLMGRELAAAYTKNDRFLVFRP
ncbi:establishment of cohesion [Dermacentor variabilis]|uniref:establishment of cohesion n=1 Tax=Dermacentor variabilis TaxID=34621 RepID=UPI003F5C8AA2